MSHSESHRTERAGWVPAGELVPGDGLQAEGGIRIVESTEEDRDEPVFNLEVDADYCYRVGEQGILVHNASLPTKGELKVKAKAYRIMKKLTKGQRNLGGIIYIRRSDCMELRYPSGFFETFIGSDGGGHTEKVINDYLTTDPVIQNNPDSIMILSFFSERRPCKGCDFNVIPQLQKKNGGPFDDQLIWFVEEGTGSNESLVTEYGGFP